MLIVELIFSVDFFLLTGEKSSKYKIYGEKFVENNKNICEIIIDDKEKELCSFLQ